MRGTKLGVGAELGYRLPPGFYLYISRAAWRPSRTTTPTQPLTPSCLDSPISDLESHQAWVPDKVTNRKLRPLHTHTHTSRPPVWSDTKASPKHPHAGALFPTFLLAPEIRQSLHPFLLWCQQPCCFQTHRECTACVALPRSRAQLHRAL